MAIRRATLGVGAGLLMALAAPSSAAAAPTLTITDLVATVAGTGAVEQIQVTDLPGDPDGTRFIGTGDSMNPWTIPVECTQALVVAELHVDCPNNLLDININAEGEADVISMTNSGADLTVEAGEGADTISAPVANLPLFMVFRGGPGNDTLSGDGDFDVLDGGDGNDTITGGNGLGQSTLDGGPGLDTITGGSADEKIIGGAGIDTIAANDGNDAVLGRDGEAETLDCGAGTDNAEADVADTPVACESVTLPPAEQPPGDDPAPGDDVDPGTTVQCPAGTSETVTCSQLDGGGILMAGTGADETLVGTGEDDKLIGGDGDDRLNAGGGDDRLKGGEGNDRLSGEDGADKLAGNAGKDRFSGGDGDDTIKSKGEANERVRCGGGRKDKVKGGEDDKVAADCESVS